MTNKQQNLSSSQSVQSAQAPKKTRRPRSPKTNIKDVRIPIEHPEDFKSDLTKAPSEYYKWVVVACAALLVICLMFLGAGGGNSSSDYNVNGMSQMAASKNASDYVYVLNNQSSSKKSIEDQLAELDERISVLEENNCNGVAYDTEGRPVTRSEIKNKQCPVYKNGDYESDKTVSEPSTRTYGFPMNRFDNTSANNDSYGEALGSDENEQKREFDSNIAQAVKERGQQRNLEKSTSSDTFDWQTYASLSKKQRLSLLQSHFATDASISEYYIKSFAAALSKNKSSQDTDVKDNIAMFLKTPFGAKTQEVYKIWASAARNPQVLSAVDDLMIESKFFKGKPFHLAAEMALLSKISK